MRRKSLNYYYKTEGCCNDRRKRLEDYRPNEIPCTSLKKACIAAQPHMGPNHCNFCWATFSEYDDDLHEGYCTPDETYWICPECFNDFKEMFHWTLEDSSKPEPE